MNGKKLVVRPVGAVASVTPIRGAGAPTLPPEIPDPEVVEPPDLVEFDDWRKRTEAWIAQNPHIYELFERYALEIAATGKKFGAKLLAERVRWETYFNTPTGEGYKICNNYVAYVARKLVADHPHLKNLLRFRQTKW